MAADVADRVAVMVNGRIAREMSATELAADRDLQERLLGARAAPARPHADGGGPRNRDARSCRAARVRDSRRQLMRRGPSAASRAGMRHKPQATHRGSPGVHIRASGGAARGVETPGARPAGAVVFEFPVAGNVDRAAYIAGTFDTKGRELFFVKQCIERLGLRTVTVDLSTSGATSTANVHPREVARHHPGGERAVFTGDRGFFHATGTGGQSMEKLLDSHLLAGVLDISTTEVCDHIVGGVLSAGRNASMRWCARAPYVGSCGALDMVNFWAWDTVPAAFRGRNLYKHNANVTLMRTTAAESKAIGEFIVGKLNRMDGPVRFVLPLGGVSALDAPGKAFWDPAADQALLRRSNRTSARARNAGLSRVRCTSTIRRSPTCWCSNGASSPPRRACPTRAAGTHDTNRWETADATNRTYGNPAAATRQDRERSADHRRRRGTGLSAKCEEAGGIDLIVIYNSGRYRMAGRGSLAGLLAYGNANDIVCEMAREVLPVVKHTPVLAGVNGTDPFMIAGPLPAPAERASAFRACRTFPPSA